MRITVWNTGTRRNVAVSNIASASASRVTSVIASTLLAGALVGCSDLSGLAGKQQLPTGVPDPASLHNRSGAVAAYQGVLAMFSSGTASTFLSGTASTSANGGTYTSSQAGTFVHYVLVSGLLTDELESGALGGSPVDYNGSDDNLLIDTRHLAENIAHRQTDDAYSELQGMRNSAGLAIAALSAYDSIDSPALRGHLYALAGYSELFLADLYCSGVPLSTLDPRGDFTYRAGSKTLEIYQAAIAQFDTAITLSGDSVRILNLARIGKGRAYLALGQYDAAAAAVSAVPTEFSYQLGVNWRPDITLSGGFFGKYGAISGGGTVADNQGRNGFPYQSSLDPRTKSVRWGNNDYGTPQYVPVAYGGALLATGSPITPITVANGIEARLIEAEAALKAGNPQWLTRLNTLRTGALVTQPADTIVDTLGITGCGPDQDHWCTADGVTNGYFVVPPGYTLAPALGFTIQPVGTALANTCYQYSYYTPCTSADGSTDVLVYIRPAGTTATAGTGGIAGLPPLADPGASPGDTARVRVVFRERAFWLYLTGNRQGDLRRLIRSYQQLPNNVYPAGGYPLSGLFSQFGGDVNAPVPSTERADPLFHGCFSRGA